MPDYTATNFYNDELTRLQAKQKNANTILNSQERLAALNDSYRKRYAKYVQILMVLVLAYGVYLAMITLQKMFPAIPQIAVDGTVIVLIFLVAFYLFSASWELYSRSVLNYDELDIPAYDASGVDVSNLKDEGQIFGDVITSPCVGKDCCPDTYDTTTNLCPSSGQTQPPSSGQTQPPNTPQIPPQNVPQIPPQIPPQNVPSVSTFTTLEYERVESAYANTSFNSAGLKREPNQQNVKPLQDVSIMSYSAF